MIESLILSCSKLYVKSKEFYYEQYGAYLLDNYDTGTGKWNEVSFDKDFRKTNLKNIIQCGMYDILIYDEHVQIFNNINPLNQLDEIVVDDDIL